MGHALITGGSSGIGLAIAKRLADDGHSIGIVARDTGRMAAAADAIRSGAPRGVEVRSYAADVGDARACLDAVRRAIEDAGPPDWAISSAGIVRPGAFLDLSVPALSEQMQTNYLGSMHFAHAVLPQMVAAGRGRLVLISSAAAFVGIYGYSGYGASKFAIRGLAEALRVEMEGKGVTVTVAYPPDTDTPQLEAERRERPAITESIAGGGGVWQADAVARLVIEGATRGRFVVAPGWQTRVLNRWHSVIGPLFRAYQRQVVRAATRQNAPR